MNTCSTNKFTRGMSRHKSALQQPIRIYNRDCTGHSTHLMLAWDDSLSSSIVLRPLAMCLKDVPNLTAHLDPMMQTGFCDMQKLLPQLLPLSLLHWLETQPAITGPGVWQGKHIGASLKLRQALSKPQSPLPSSLVYRLRYVDTRPG